MKRHADLEPGVAFVRRNPAQCLLDDSGIERVRIVFSWSLRRLLPLDRRKSGHDFRPRVPAPIAANHFRGMGRRLPVPESRQPQHPSNVSSVAIAAVVADQPPA